MNGPVLFLSAEYPPMHGGIGDYTARLVEALTAHDWDVHVLTSSTVQPGDKRVLTRVRRWNWDVAKVTQQALNETGARIIHIQYQTGAYKMHPAINFLPGRLRKKNPQVRWVTTFHDLLPPYLFPKAGPLRERITRVLANNSDVSIATNERDLERLAIEHRLARRVSMIPIGSNLPDISSVDRNAMRSKIGIEDPDQIAIGFFGFLSEDKGVDVLLEALSQRSWKQPTALVIIGGGLSATDVSNRPYLTWIEERLKACPVQVIETGYLPAAEAAAALRSMDVVALPFRRGASLRRGTLIAAIRAGATVLTTDPESDETLAPLVGGETMWLVPPSDAVALREGLRTLIDDPALRRQLAFNAQTRGIDFDWNAIAQRHIEIYENLLSRVRGHDGAS